MRRPICESDNSQNCPWRCLRAVSTFSEQENNDQSSSKQAKKVFIA